MAATKATVIPFEDLKPGDRVQITQRIKVGLKIWTTEITGLVLRTERRRNGLHVYRNWDDKAYTDLIVLQTDTGGIIEESAVTMDEYTRVEPA